MRFGDISMKSSLEWCKGQKKGLRLVNPSAAVAESFFRKAESALNMLNSALEKNELDWIVTTSYYAKYFAFYSILAKCGIKCEIHDCTISAAEAIFVDADLMDLALYKDLEESKELRVDMQYYAYAEFDKDKVIMLAHSAPDFVLRMRELLERISEKEINLLRTKLQK